MRRPSPPKAKNGDAQAQEDEQPRKLKLFRTAASAGEADDAPNTDGWLMTYTDTVTLLITLFVVLLSIANFEKVRSSGVIPDTGTRLLGSMFGQQTTAMTESAETTAPVIAGEVWDEIHQLREQIAAFEVRSARQEASRPAAPPDGRDRIVSGLRKTILSSGLGESAVVKTSAAGIIIQISDKVLFPSGSAEILEGGARTLATLVPILQAGAFDIAIEGHTDNIPISTHQFPSNWELSSGRAASVVKFLVRHGVAPRRLRAVGYGETRPLASNLTAEGKQQNRRVEILLIMPEAS